MLEERPRKVSTYKSYVSTFTTYVQDPPNKGFSSSMVNLGTDMRSGSQNPVYQEQIRARADATTSFNGVLHSGVPPFIDYSFRAYRSKTSKVAGVQPTREVCEYSGSGNGYFPGAIPTATSSDPTAANDAKKRFIKQAQQVQTGMSGVTFLGELKETVSMLRSPLKSLREASVGYLSTLRKGRRRSSSYNKGFLADTWLEFQYGVLPLASDAESAILSYRRLTTDLTTYKKVSGSGDSQSLSSQGMYTTALDGSGLSAHISAMTSIYKTARYRGLVSRRCTSSAPGIPTSLQEFNRIFGLKMTLENFVPAAWELLPFSFLVDYFANVGDIINATAWDTSTLRWANCTLRSDSRTIYGGRLLESSRKAGFTDRDFVSSYASVSPGKYTKRTVSRASASPQSMIPDLNFVLPGSNIRWANIGALLTQHAKLLPYF